MGSENRLNRFFQVDVFADAPFKGNPTAVCVMDKPTDGNYLASLAAEFGLNQTAFLTKQGDLYSIRFFTKFAEVPMCLHSAIAAAHVLHQIGEVDPLESVTFKTAKSTILVVMEDGLYKVSLPEYQLAPEPITPEFVEITGVNPNELYRCSHDWFLAYFKEHEDMRRCLPHFVKMKHSDFGHLIITSHGFKGEADYVQRSFAPMHGVNEEDISGPAQCALVPFWKGKLHKTHFISHQLTARGGELITRSVEGKMVEVLGKALIVLEGKF